MFVVFIVLILGKIGSFEARHPDIDINRIKLVANEESHSYGPSSHGRRSVNEVIKNGWKNNIIPRSGKLFDPRPTMHLLHEPSTEKDPKGLKFHQPREDPRLFYQSIEYLKEIASKDLNNEVSYIYPGREVIRPEEKARLRSYDINKDDSLKYNVINLDTPCVRCPHDRTLITKPGSDRVVLQYPRLQSCSHGRRLPRNVRFVHMYGPNFGSLLEQGNHVVVGKIIHNHKTLQVCKMQISVLAQTCTTPKTLIAHCKPDNKNCSFTCRNTKHVLHGRATLSCEGGKMWSGDLPICEARTWCEPLFPPEHGHISCKGTTIEDGIGLLEGSTCRVRCKRGWKWAPRASAVCRKGAWTHGLTCQPKRT